MKYLYTLSFVVFSVFYLQAQQVIPLSENPVLLRYHAQRESQLPDEMQFSGRDAEKQLCDLEKPGITYVEAGKTAVIQISIDTVGLDTLPGAFSCVNCDGNPVGTASVIGDSLVLTAAADIIGLQFDFEVQFCNPNGCNSRIYTVIARRKGRNYFPGTFSLESEEIATAEADPGVLPAPVICSYFSECKDNYEGRDQLVYFTDYSKPDHRFVYRASRYSGVDSVCLTLCDTFAICDTFRFAFHIRHDTLSLPFMDDFSYEGPHPASTHWLDTDVFINNTMGEKPPSVGVATFDGLDGRGRPYGGGDGEADWLTSTYINLSNAPANLHLTYWLQRRGLGDRPEVRDSMILEFRNASGKWIRVRELPGIPVDQPNSVEEPFRFYSQEISQEYRYNGFRFRFKNLADRKGALDNWHLDYVRISAAPDPVFSDIAFTNLPEPILRNYTSMPWRHFKGSEAAELSDVLEVGLYNHAAQDLNASPSTVTLMELNSNVNLFSPEPTLFNGLEANIPFGVSSQRTYSLIDDPTGFPQVWGDYLLVMSGPAFDNYDQLEFLMEYSFVNTSQITDVGYEAVQRNDKVERTTIFDNYFAYDDGSAEAGLITPEDTDIAVKFTTAVEDTLRAIRLNLPRISVNVSDQQFILKVWVGELDDTPEFQLLTEPYYTDLFYDTLQGFTTYPLVDENGDYAPLALPAGDFYVGWQQATSCDFTACIPVGYDKNRPQAKQFISRNFGLGWTPLPASTPGGALMIRPVVGSETPGYTDVDEPKPVLNDIRLYPNPASDALYIDLPDRQYGDYFFQVFNNIGQLVLQGALEPHIRLEGLVAGIHYVRIANLKSTESISKKIIVAK